MAIPASKVRAICTPAEGAIIRASRKAELEKLSHAEVKRLAVQTRKLLDKWRDQGRSQARARSQKVGFGEKPANTRLKVELFGETLQRLEARLAKLDPSAGGGKKTGPTKKDRNAEHRATRAAMRKGMTAAEDLVNEGKHKKRAAAAKSTPVKSAPEKASSKHVVAKHEPATPAPIKLPKPAAESKPSVIELLEARSVTTLAPPKKLRNKVGSLDPAKQRKAVTAAKQSRVTRSGKTTRTLSHVKARGKRNQARRDAKN